MELNKYQSTFEDLQLDSYPQEVQDEFMDAINSVPLIQHLISPNRPLAKDCPRDEKGRIIVDLTNPPIIEDTDYFRPVALFYKKHGKMTNLRPNANPNSEFGKWIREEVRRIWYGYVRESDGAWVTGDMYFYLNYCPIIQSKIRKGTKIADRIVDTPEFWEGIWWRSNYIDQARNLGHHCAEIAKRGAAHPYDSIVYTPTGKKLWKDIQIGDYLFGDDGHVTKVINIPFDDECDIYEFTLKDGRKVQSSDNHLWNVLYRGRPKVMTTLEILDKYKQKRIKSDRNPSGVEYIVSIPSNKGVDWEEVPTKVDPYTFGLLLGDGSFRHSSCYYTCEDSDFQEIKDYIPYSCTKWNSKYAYRIHIDNWTDILNSYCLNNKKSEDKFIPDEYKYNSRRVRLELLKGLIDSDGYLDRRGVYTVTLTSKILIDDIAFIARSLGYNCSYTKQNAGYKKNGEYIQCSPAYVLSIYTEDILCKLSRKKRTFGYSNNYAKSHVNSTRIVDARYIGRTKAKCVTVDNDSHCYLIEDFVTTHNSKSYFVASILAKLFILGENEDTSKSVRAMVTAYQKEYLVKDGTLNKFVEMIDYIAQNMEFPAKRLRSSLQDMQWKMGYVDLDTGTQKGTLNEIIGVSSKDDPDKLRGKRPHPLSCKVLTTNGIKSWGDIMIGDYVYNQQGKPVQVIDVIDYDEDDIYKITLKDGRVTYAQGDHLFPIYYRASGVIKSRLEKVSNLLETKWYNKKGIPTYKWALPKNECIDFNEQQLPIDPYTFGLYLGDGDYAHSWNTRLNLTMVPKDLKSILQYIPYEVKISKYRDITHHVMIDGARDILKSLGLENKKSGDKFIPHIYLFNSESNRIALLNGLLDTDGSCTKDYGIIEYSTKSTRLKDDVLFLCRSLGYNCTSKERVIKGVTYYKCYIYTSDTRLFNLQRKKRNLRKKCPAYSDRCPISSIELYNREKCRCITVDSEDGLYLIDDFIVTHNSSRIIIEEFGNFPKVTDTYRVILPSVQEGNIVFGQMILIGTGGSEGADFAGANEIIYNPLGFNIYAVPNVYDKSAQGKNNTIFFFGAYVNRKGCYNQDGISDVTKALLELCYDRYLVKYNTTDSMALTRTKAENPITLQEAIMRRDSTLFPVATIMDRIHQIDGNPNEYDDVYVGELELKKDGKVEFKPTSAQPIRHFPHKDNKLEGAVEIFKMPELDRDGKPFNGRYIASQDPYDDDSAETMSLGSTFILDLWTDKVVAEYTGRPMFADDYYETSRRLCLFYNARMNYENNKKGLFAYFSKMNCLYLLTDVLEFLKDKDMVKGQLYGNKAHPYSEKVYTPQGIKKWGDINVGDCLYGTKGEITKVIDIPFDSTTDIYEITLKDGRKVRASKNHLWNVIDWNGYSKVLSTSQIEHGYYRERGKYKEYKYYIPSNMGVEYNNIEVKLPPYFMGIMLGDGCFTNSRHNQAYFTSTVNDINEYKNNVPFTCKTRDNRHHCWVVPNIGKILIEYGLQEAKSHTKFIPNEYKYNSKEVRLEVLQGLLDTDGHVGYGGNPEYVTVSNKLCDDVIEVARSLGINCNKQVSVNSYGKVYKVIFYTNIKLFKLTRKASRQRITKTRAYKTAIVNIEYIGKEKSKCVTVDSDDSCYLIGDFITTHNSKGTNATTPINAYARILIRNWLLKPVVTVQVVDGEEQEVTVPNLMFIKSKALLQELSQWNPDGNFDRVSSLGMLMLLREDKMITLGGDVSKAINHNRESDLSNDDFFKKNYDSRFKKPVNLVKNVAPEE